MNPRASNPTGTAGVARTEAGLFTFGSANLGDEMQSLAVLAHLNRVQAFLDRDHLADVQAVPPTACVFNSWFLLGDDLRLPSSRVQPIWHGFCLGADKLLPAWLPYFKSQSLFGGPLGCRDLRSTEILNDAGVPAHWTGCLTLFLGAALQLPRAERKGVLFVDVPATAEQFMPREIVQRATRVSTFPPPGTLNSPLERWAMLGRLVSLISQAELVVTRRLHVALPAASFGTPVVAIPDADIADARRRFSGFEKIIPTVFLDEAAAGLKRLDWRNLPPAQIPDAVQRAHVLLENKLRSQNLHGAGTPLTSPLDHYGSQTQWLTNVTRIQRPGQLRLRLRDRCFELPIVLWSEEFIEVGLRGFPGLSKFDFVVEVCPWSTTQWIPWGQLRDLLVGIEAAPSGTPQVSMSQAPEPAPDSAPVTTPNASSVNPSPKFLPEPVAPMTSSNSAVRKLCLVSFFSPSDSDGWRWLKRYQDELNHQQMELVVLSCVPSPDPEIRVILLPLWMQGYAQAYGTSATPVTLEAPMVPALAQRDRAWSGQDERPLADFTDGLGACQHVLRTLLHELQPAAVMVWSDILPQSIVLQHLAQQNGVPCWIIERGLLPETLMVEMTGQVGQSELNRSFTLNRVWQHSTDTALFSAAQAAYLAKGQTKYAQAEALDPAAFQQKFNPDGRKLVAALLQSDIASNLYPLDYPGARVHQTAFESTVLVLRQLAQAAAQQQCLVIAKPHPLDRADYSSCESEHLRIVRDVNLLSLIRAADVVAGMTSSTQFEALLNEKPILLLARSPLANKGVAYEPASGAELPNLLRAALERQGFEARRNAGRRFIDFLLRHFSVALTDTSLAEPKLADLAQFINRNSIATPDPKPVDERLTACGDWLLLWESSPKAATPKPTTPAVTAAPNGTNGSPRPAQISMNYQSHIGQDAWVAECLGFKKQGYFLDFGAFDGKTISNTYALEKDLGWRGICVEPNPRYYPQVCECRSCISVNVALWTKSRELVRFVDAHGLSAIESFKDGDSNTERRSQATHAVIAVDTLNPTELLDRFNAPRLIDYLTLDVEGAEFDILSALDLKKYAIALMTIEHNHDTPRQEQIRKYLAQFGYEVVQNRNDDFFFHRGHLQQLLGRTVDPVAIFQKVYDTFPIAEIGKPKTAPAPAATPRAQTPNHVLDILSKSPDTLRVIGTTLCQQGNWAEAGQIYQTLAGKLPDDFGAWQGRIECARRQGHTVMAELILEEALERHPEWSPQLANN